VLVECLMNMFDEYGERELHLYLNVRVNNSLPSRVNKCSALRESIIPVTVKEVQYSSPAFTRLW
jgi:hypothetical protein